MSGYPNKTSYDATQRRNKYLEELALRARLDDENLQANKLYKRTGAISTPADTRTTTEKLADTYRLRIDIRSKLGQLMSGDDAQKVVNRLDNQELVFLIGRIDKYIAELKPKYSMGMPYLIFIKFFKDAVSNFMAYGDIDLNTAAVFENVARTEDLRNSIDAMVRQMSIAGKKELILKIEGLDDFYNMISQATMILPGIADPTLKQNIENSLLAIENIPTANEIDDLRIEFEQALRTGSIDRERELELQLIEKLEEIGNLQGEKEALRQNLEAIKQDVPAQEALKKSGVVGYYYGDFNKIESDSYYSSGANGRAIKLFNQIVDVANDEVDKKLEFDKWILSHSPLFDKIKKKDKGKPYVDVLNKIGGITAINKFIQDNKDWINTFMDMELQFAYPPKTQQPQAQPQPQPQSQPRPQPPPSTDTFTDSEKNELIRTYIYPKSMYLKSTKSMKILMNSNQDFKDLNLSKDDLNKITSDVNKLANIQLKQFIKTKDKTYFDDPINLDNFVQAFDNYIIDEVRNITELIEKEVVNSNPIPSGPYTPINNFSTIYGGSIRMKKATRMKGGSIRIDTNAGIAPQDKPINYVPFGKYIINRNKLNDGVVMIKRPNGTFMGDLTSRRVSNNLRNVFNKIVGGAIPSYQDFAKLDDDEKQYLHHISKKANLVDKLNVPTPNKDEEEKMINRYEILRGQLVAGNDNKQLITEFKKLLLDMSDRKLLPRRQVSDILIDIEKTFG
jgi:hypothetical protein